VARHIGLGAKVATLEDEIGHRPLARIEGAVAVVVEEGVEGHRPAGTRPERVSW